MKTYLLTAGIFILSSCSNSSEKKIQKASTRQQSVEKQSFFPVTAYIKGQLHEITLKGINPLYYTTINSHTDSVWLKIEDITSAVQEFLSPEIDSLNLISFFTEKKFFDKTINTYTFSYEPSGILSDTMPLKNWDVYVDPATGYVKRIYIVKQPSANKILQLTWQGNKWCKITTLAVQPDGTAAVEKEEKITWDF